MPTHPTRLPRSLFLLPLLVLAVAFLVACDGDEDESSAASTPTPTEVATGTTGSGSNAGGGAVGTPEVTGEVEWEQCPFQDPGTGIECGALVVPADRDNPDAGTVRLRFGVVPGADGAPEDPVVYLSGGPGQSALEFVSVAYGLLYEPLAGDRTLVIVDQRGTGFSEPSLFCDEYLTWAMDSLGSDASPEEQATESAEALEECRQRLIDEGIDFGNYDSAASAADLEDLRAALGYQQWNLYGNSYGTRLALTAMRDYPAGIRSVILDAVYPVEANLYAEAPRNAERAMDAFFATCDADPNCADQFPELKQTFTALVDRLNAEPASITVPNPNPGPVGPARFQSPLSGDGLVAGLFQSLYATDLIPFLPEIIAAADQGDFGTIGLLQGAFAAELGYVSLGMQLAVQCHEEVPFASAQDLETASADYPLVEGFFTSAATLGPQMLELCDDWGSGMPDAVEDEPVESDIPTLVMTGNLDPITPPRWGEAIASSLSAAQFFEFPYTGHGVLVARDCGVQMAQSFLDAPGAEVDDSCIDAIVAPPFTTAEVDVQMVPYVSPLGFEGARPEGWDEAVPGVFQQSLLVALIQQALPGATVDQVMQQVAMQLGMVEAPQPAEEVEVNGVAWRRYELSDLGQAVDLALADYEGTLLMIQLGTTPLRRDVYYEQVFLPALEAFDPS